MLILVRYCDNDYDIVEDYCLEYLIVTGKIVEFSRSDEWVKVGSKQTREMPGETLSIECAPYRGQNRRKKTAAVFPAPTPLLPI
ncbi:MAG: hypothetical protein HZC44_06880 [Geobacter sp.]|nr:hypothetical protein [Geobacter sp.]